MFTSLQNHYNQLIERFRAPLSGISDRIRSVLKIGQESSLRIWRRQMMVGGCLVVVIIAFVYGIITVLFDKPPLPKQEAVPKPTPINIATAPSKVDMNEVRWLKLDTALTSLQKDVSGIKKIVYGEPQDPSNSADETGTLENKGAESPKAPQIQENVQGTPAQGTHTNDPRFQELETRLSFLETQQNSQQQRPLDNPYSQNPGNGEEQDGRVIQKLALSLSNKSKDLKTVETTIPAGAFAKTVLLSGLDASSAMNASSDPRPMLLRIIDHGTLPRRFQSDLKDCHCTAGAFGDLSSERVYARLEKLTCVERKTGEIIETQVAGYVAGSDGKAGIRGIVASKDGQFLARSLMGGIFSGLSNVANPQNRRAQVNPFVGAGAGVPMAGPSIGENFTAGMAGGATTALDRLSQYYIDRAEQLQPVIQIAAGQVVDIVFTEGTFIGSQTIRSEIEKRDESRREDSHSQNHQPSNNERN